MAAIAAGEKTGAVRRSRKIFPLRPMDRRAAVAKRPVVCGRAWSRADGRHPVRGESLQRGCLLASGPIRDGLVRWRATGAVLQGRRVHPKMGTKLGDPALPLGRNADAKPRLVALASARGAQDISRLPDRSRARLLPDLRFSVA